MSLGDAQRAFCFDTSVLIQYIFHYEGGIYSATWGDAYRDPRVHGEQGVKSSYSAARSAHKQRLAIDLNLYRDGVYLTDTEDHRPFGEWWKRQHPDNRWGGDFTKADGRPRPDGNHYSRTYWGIA